MACLPCHFVKINHQSRLFVALLHNHKPNTLPPADVLAPASVLPCACVFKATQPCAPFWPNCTQSHHCALLHERSPLHLCPKPCCYFPHAAACNLLTPLHSVPQALSALAISIAPVPETVPLLPSRSCVCPPSSLAFSPTTGPLLHVSRAVRRSKLRCYLLSAATALPCALCLPASHCCAGCCLPCLLHAPNPLSPTRLPPAAACLAPLRLIPSVPHGCLLLLTAWPGPPPPICASCPQSHTLASCCCADLCLAWPLEGLVASGLPDIWRCMLTLAMSLFTAALSDDMLTLRKAAATAALCITAATAAAAAAAAAF